jgi:hypothetical protein
MSTNSDIIADALRELGVISEVQTPSAEQGAHGLRKLNQLGAELEGQGIRLQWFAQSVLSDPFPVADEFEHGFMCLLAIRLAPNYGAGASVSSELALSAQTGYEHMCRVSVSADLQPVNIVNRPSGAGDRQWPSDFYRSG